MTGLVLCVKTGKRVRWRAGIWGWAGMRTGRWGIAVAVVALGLVAACGNSNREPRLMNLRTGADGPDEFAILPPKGLETPPDLTALPEPTPGGANLTDQNPLADAIVALGGKPAAGGAVDGALVNYAARSGVTAGIRTTLAAEDLQFRKDHPGKLLERAFQLTTYYSAYKDLTLDAYAEMLRWRAAGVATPSAPPDPANR